MTAGVNTAVTLIKDLRDDGTVSQDPKDYVYAYASGFVAGAVFAGLGGGAAAFVEKVAISGISAMGGDMVGQYAATGEINPNQTLIVGVTAMATTALLSGAGKLLSSGWEKLRNFLADETGSIGGGAGGNPKTNFYVTPKGDAIPGTQAGLDNNLSMMENTGAGKYVGNGSNGPVRIRIEGGHLPTDVPSFLQNPYHEIPHIHVEYRANIFTGGWGDGLNNIFTLVKDWFK